MSVKLTYIVVDSKSIDDVDSDDGIKIWLVN